MNIDNFSYKDFLPYYLTEDQKKGLANAMRGFSGHSQLYTQNFQDETLQGDYWAQMPYMDFDSGRKDKIKVLILSNSCDIDQSNSRDLPVYMTYAPIIGLASYEKHLLAKGLDRESVAAKIEAIRTQKITSMIFLPASSEIEDDSVALLDRAISVPYKSFQTETEKRKVTSLNQFGHYLLSFKLSIHYCRMHEGIPRG
jgi:hypothetical protein